MNFVKLFFGDKYKKLFWLFCLVFLGFILRTVGLNKSLSGDEILTVSGARQEPTQIISYLISQDAHPPLYYFVLHYWLKISQQDFWLRLLSIIFGTGICIMGFLIGSRYYDQKLGFLILLFLIISPGLIWQAQYVRPYAFSTFFMCLSVYFLLTMLYESFKWSNWLGYVLSSLFSIYSFYLAGLFILGQNIFFLFYWKKFKRLLKTWIFAQLSIGIIFLPWAILTLKQLLRLTNQQVVFVKKGFYFLNLHIGGILRYLGGCLGLDPLFLTKEPIYGRIPNYLLWISVFLICLCGFSLIWIFIKGFKRFRGNLKINNLFFLTLVGTSFAIGNFIHHAFNFGIVSYHFIPCFVFLTFVVISFILLIKIKWLRIVFLILLFALSLTRTGQLYFLYPEPWKELVQNIENKSSNSKTIVCLLRGDLMSYNYYSRFETPQVVLSSYFDRDPKTLDLVAINHQQSLKLRDLLSPYDELWLIHFTHEVFGGKEIIKNWLENQGYKEIEENVLGQITAVRYKRT